MTTTTTSRTRRGRLVLGALALVSALAVVPAPSTARFVDTGTVRASFTATQPEDLLFTGGVAAGDAYSLGWETAGALYAWGSNSRGQLGDGTTGGTRARPHPVALPDDHPVTHAAAGIDMAIALTADGGVYTWGNPDIAENTATPHRVTYFDGRDDPVVQVDAGGYFYLAVTASGELYSWGVVSPRLGQWSGDPHGRPHRVISQGLHTRVVTRAAAGRFHGTAVAEGEVVAWGDSYGARGGLTVSGVAGVVSGVAAGRALTLIWTEEGRVLSAGGSGTATVVTGLDDVVGVAASSPETDGASFWAWDRAGGVFAWGTNRDGQLGLGGTGPTVTVPTPVPLADGAAVRMVAGGARHALVESSTFHYAAAGSNTVGQLGDGSTAPRSSFTAVIPVQRWP